MVGPLGNLFWDSRPHPHAGRRRGARPGRPGGPRGRGPHRPGPGRHVRVRPGPGPAELDLRAGRHPGLRPGRDGGPRARRLPRRRRPARPSSTGRSSCSSRATPAAWRSTAPGTPPGNRRSSCGARSPPTRPRSASPSRRVRLGHPRRQRRDPPPLRDPHRGGAGPGLPPPPPGRVEGGRAVAADRDYRGLDRGRDRHGRRRRRRPRCPGRGGPLLPRPQRPRQGPVPGLGERARLGRGGHQGPTAKASPRWSTACSTKPDQRGQTALKVHRVRVDAMVMPSVSAERTLTSLYEAIHRRRDVRGQFTGAPIDPEALERVLAAAHAAPSVGLTQPWDFVLVSDVATKQAFVDARHRRAGRLRRLAPARAGRGLRQHQDRRRHGVDPVGRRHLRRRPGRARRPRPPRHRRRRPLLRLPGHPEPVAGRHRRGPRRGLGVVLPRAVPSPSCSASPTGVRPVAWLCLGPVSHLEETPDLERHGWRQRRPLSEAVHHERWTGKSRHRPHHSPEAKRPRGRSRRGSVGRRRPR